MPITHASRFAAAALPPFARRVLTRWARRAPRPGPLCAAMLLVGAASSVAGHPGSGLEVAADGTVYLTDVGSETIWRIGPGGEASAVVAGSWTHELQLDADGTLVYEREHAGFERAPQSLREIGPDGRERVLIAPPSDRARFGSGAFARMPDGSVVFAHTVRGEDGAWRAIVRQRAADDHDGSRVRTIAGALGGRLYRDGPGERATFRMIVNMRPRADGSVLLLDRDRVRVLAPDGAGGWSASTIGPPLIDERPADPPTRGGPRTTWNRLYGLADAPDGSVLVAYQAGRRVVRIVRGGRGEADGPGGGGGEGGGIGGGDRVEPVHASDAGWAPIGVAVGPEGVVHVSEISDRGGRLRVLRLEDGGARELATIPPA